MGGHPTSWLWRYVAERYGGPPTVGGKLKTARGSPRRPGLAYHSFRATRWRARRFFLSGSHTLDASTRIYTVRSHTVHESAKSKDANARRHHRCKIERFRRIVRTAVCGSGAITVGLPIRDGRAEVARCVVSTCWVRTYTHTPPVTTCVACGSLRTLDPHRTSGRDERSVSSYDVSELRGRRAVPGSRVAGVPEARDSARGVGPCSTPSALHTEEHAANADQAERSRHGTHVAASACFKS